MYDISQLNDMIVPELLDIADQLKIPNAKKLEKPELISKILGGQPASNGSDKDAEGEKRQRKRIVKPAATTASAPKESTPVAPALPFDEEEEKPRRQESRKPAPKKDEKPAPAAKRGTRKRSDDENEAQPADQQPQGNAEAKKAQADDRLVTPAQQRNAERNVERAAQNGERNQNVDWNNNADRNNAERNNPDRRNADRNQNADGNQNTDRRQSADRNQNADGNQNNDRNQNNERSQNANGNQQSERTLRAEKTNSKARNIPIEQL